MSTPSERILDHLTTMKEAGAWSGIEQLIAADTSEVAATLDAAEDLLDDPSLSDSQRTRLKELMALLDAWLAATEKGVSLRAARSAMRRPRPLK